MKSDAGFQFPNWWDRWPTLRDEFIPVLRALTGVAAGIDHPEHHFTEAERKQALWQLARLRRLLHHPRMQTVFETVMQRARDTRNSYLHTSWKHHGDAWCFKSHEAQIAAYIINIASNAHRLPYTTAKEVRAGRAPSNYLRLDRSKGDTRARASAKFMGLAARAAFGNIMIRSVRTMLEVALPGHHVSDDTVREQCGRQHRRHGRVKR